MNHNNDQITLTMPEATKLVQLLQAVEFCDELPNGDPIKTEAGKISDDIADHIHQARAEANACFIQTPPPQPPPPQPRGSRSIQGYHGSPNEDGEIWCDQCRCYHDHAACF